MVLNGPAEKLESMIFMNHPPVHSKGVSMWHLTPDTWHQTLDKWQLKHDTLPMTPFFLYRCSYPHTLRDSVSPVCWIFSFILWILKNVIYTLCISWHFFSSVLFFFLCILLNQICTRGWTLCEIMDQEGAGFLKPGQQQRLLFPKWRYAKMIIFEKYAPLVL